MSFTIYVCLYVSVCFASLVCVAEEKNWANQRYHHTTYHFRYDIDEETKTMRQSDTYTHSHRQRDSHHITHTRFIALHLHTFFIPTHYTKLSLVLTLPNNTPELPHSLTLPSSSSSSSSSSSLLFVCSLFSRYIESHAWYRRKTIIRAHGNDIKQYGEKQQQQQ